MVLPLLRQPAGVMEWCSIGVVKGSIQVKIRVLASSSTPILQYSKNSSQSSPAKSLYSVLALRTGFAMLSQDCLGMAFAGKMIEILDGKQGSILRATCWPQNRH